MARIRKAEEPQFTPGTPEFTMAQEQRRQQRQGVSDFVTGLPGQYLEGQKEQQELSNMMSMLLSLSMDSSLSSSERQEARELVEDLKASGISESGVGAVVRAIGSGISKLTKNPTAQKITGGTRASISAIRDKASSFLNKVRPKTKAKGDAGDFGTSGFADDIGGARRAQAAKTKYEVGRADELKDILKGSVVGGIPASALLAWAYKRGILGQGEEPQQSGLAETSPELVRRQEKEAGREWPYPYKTPEGPRPPLDYTEDPRPPLDYNREEPSAPEEPSALEEPQPRLQLPMPGQEEEPEGPEDTRTPRQKRKFISTPGRPRGAKRRNPFYVPPPGGEEAEADVEQRPGLPMTGVPGEQPEAIPDMTPTDQDIEGLFDGQGMPERFQGVDFIDTPEGQALLQNRMTPMSPEEQAPSGGIDPLTPTPRMPASPTFETPGMTPRIPPQMPLPETGPTPSPDQRIQDLPRLMPELGRQMRPEVPSPESPEDRIEEDPTLIKEDVLDDLATMRPQDAGPPTDDDIVGLFEGRNVPVSQLSREEAQTQLDQMKAKFEEQPGLGMTQEDEKRFKELMKVLKWKPITAGSDWSVVPWESR